MNAEYISFKCGKIPQNAEGLAGMYICDTCSLYCKSYDMLYLPDEHRCHTDHRTPSHYSPHYQAERKHTSYINHTVNVLQVHWFGLALTQPYPLIISFLFTTYFNFNFPKMEGFFFENGEDTHLNVLIAEQGVIYRFDNCLVTKKICGSFIIKFIFNKFFLVLIHSQTTVLI